MGLKRAYGAAALLGFAFCVSALPARAQITVSSLDAAKPFAPGAAISDLSGLDANAWQGTSAARGAGLLGAAPKDTADPIVRDMLRRVALSGLVPPTSRSAEMSEQFDAARIALAQGVATRQEYMSFAQRNGALANDPIRRADARLAQGDLLGACELSDQLSVGRGESYWVRLRAACHEARGETAAAELARDILRDRGEETAVVIGEAPSGFWADVSARLDDPAALSVFMREIAQPPQPEPAPDVALEGAPQWPEGSDASMASGASTAETAIPGALDMIAEGDQGTAQAFFLAEQGAADAMAFVARAAREAGLDPYRVIAANQGRLDPKDMALADLPLFADYAIVSGDLGLLQALYSAAPDDLREPIALASDAMGGGFRSGPLGDDIDLRLTGATKERSEFARRDALIAMALGANLSDAAAAVLSGEGESAPDAALPFSLIALDVAARSGSRAETLLLAAALLDEGGALNDMELYSVLRSLETAGFFDLAAQIAARDFLRSL